MKPFDVQAIAIQAPPESVFEFAADRFKLPQWTHAFKQIGASTAMMQTPAGELEVDLSVLAHRESGTIDWIMKFPDRSIGRAYARVVSNVDASTIFCFILLAPPVPQELIEGTLEQQRAILRDELQRLKNILERRA